MLSKVPIKDAFQFNEMTTFISSPWCAYSSSRHRSNEVKNYVMNLEVEGKVSVLMGLASASAKYRHKDESSCKRDVISLSCSVYARKGFLIPHKETLKYTDKGVDFNVEGMEIGMEDILLVTSAYERDNKRTENATEFKAKVLFFSISGKLESVQENSDVKGFVRIDYYSSCNRQWRAWQFDGNSYGEALKQIKRIESYMCNIPNIVSRTPYDALPHLRMMVTPKVLDGTKIALYLELQNRMKAVQVSTDFCSVSETDKLKHLLKDLEEVDIEKCSWEFLDSITGKCLN